MNLDQKLIEEIIGRILTVTQPERIILFGSAAKGEMTRDSDIDLIVLKKAAPRQSSKGKRTLALGPAWVGPRLRYHRHGYRTLLGE